MSLLKIETDNYLFQGWRNATRQGLPPGFFLMKKFDYPPEHKFAKAYGWCFEMWVGSGFPWVRASIEHTESDEFAVGRSIVKL